MSTVERLLNATEDIWAGYHEKPFVQGLKNGTLDVKKFRRYIIQDYWYLMDYTKVFAVGVAKSKSVEVMKLFAKYIQAILDGEVNVHNGYMADFGITQEELADAQDQIDALNDQLAEQEEDAAQTEKKIDALLGLLEHYGVIELVRSGAVAVTRGPRALSEKVVGSEVTGR